MLPPFAQGRFFLERLPQDLQRLSGHAAIVGKCGVSERGFREQRQQRALRAPSGEFNLFEG